MSAEKRAKHNPGEGNSSSREKKDENGTFKKKKEVLRFTIDENIVKSDNGPGGNYCSIF
jgi:hypothetical protein